MLSRFKKLWRRYNPKRTYIEMNGWDLVWMAEVGFVEYYHGEWFFTELGIEALNEGVKYANVCSRGYVSE